MTLDELTNLRSQAAHHFKKLQIRRTRYESEKLQHSQALATKKDRNGERCTESVCLGGRPAEKARISGDVGNPFRLGAYPKLGP